jgi:hypothetical protein
MSLLSGEDDVARKRVVLTPRQKRNIARAFRKNRAVIDRALEKTQREITKSHRVLEFFVLGIDSEIGHSGFDY